MIAEVLDQEGKPVVEPAECPALRLSAMELAVAIPVGERRRAGHVRIQFVCGAEPPVEVAVPLPVLYEAIGRAEEMVRRLIEFPGDSAVHRAHQSRLAEGMGREPSLERARDEVTKISQWIEAGADMSPVLRERLRLTTRRTRDKSLAAIEKARAER